MLPRLSELRLKAAPVPVRVGGSVEEERQRRRTSDQGVSLNVLMGLSEDVWQNILNQIDDKDACDEIGRICIAGGKFIGDDWKGRTMTPIQSLCGKDSTYDQLNRSLGWYKPFENLAEVLEWCKANATQAIAVGMAEAPVERRAWHYFASICQARRGFLQAKARAEPGHGEDWRELESAYRRLITAMATEPRGAPASYANAKWMVRTDAEHTFEFIPGSCSTLDRLSNLDLNPDYPDDHPLRVLAQRTNVVMGTGPGDSLETLDDAAIVGYTEIAKIAVAEGYDQLKHVRGSINATTGLQNFPLCKDYAEIAKVAVSVYGSCLANVPGSTLNVLFFTEEIYRDRSPDPLPNYTELAKLAAFSKKNRKNTLRFVPGSINPKTGRQLRPPIDDYYAIAEVHVRMDPWSLMYVPGSCYTPRGFLEFRAPPLKDYAALAKIAIAESPKAFVRVPPDMPEYAHLEAFRNQVVAIENDPAEFEKVASQDPNYVALARAAIARDPNTFRRVPETFAAYDELKTFRDQVAAIANANSPEQKEDVLSKIRQDVPGYFRLLGLRNSVVREKRVERRAAE